MAIIGDVAFTPAEPVAGDSVRVDVKDAQGNPYNNSETVLITIDGVPGSSQYIQVPTAGTRRVLVTAAGPQGREQTIASVTVAAASAPVEALPGAFPGAANLLEAFSGPPVLAIARRPHVAYGAGFSVVPLGMIGLAEAPKLDEPAPEQHAPETSLARTLTERTLVPVSSVFHADKPLAVDVPLSTQLASRGLVAHLGALTGGVDTPATPYTWDFGDGTSVATSEPVVEHDYEPALGLEREWEQFHLSVTIDAASGPRTITRTVSVHNAYVACKKRGYIVPTVVVDEFADKQPDSFSGSATVRNKEQQALTLTSWRAVPVLSDPSTATQLSDTNALSTPLVIGAGSSTPLSVSVGFDVVPADSAGFVVHYFGTAEDGTAVRVNVHFDVRPEDRTPDLRLGRIAIAQLLAEANVPPGGGVELTRANTNEITNEAQSSLLRTLTEANQLRTATPAHLTAAVALVDPSMASSLRLAQTASNVAHVMSSPDGTASIMDRLTVRVRDALGRVAFSGLRPAAPPPSEGAECDPDNLPDGVPDGWACQATSETRTVITPGRFMNARKGDAVLSPGGNGLIGGLLRQVAPPQRYSHSGLMTRNHDEITHCTASEDRMQAYPVGTNPVTGEPAATDGFRPDVVKYGWPGVISQTVENAVHGEWFVDPETAGSPPDQQKSYQINAFGSQPAGMDIDGVWTIVPPMVVKPDPIAETADLRLHLHAVADDARAQVGKAHYRFYCYTDPTIGQTTSAPADAGWAAGTFPAVCSSFVWMMMKRNATQLEGPDATTRQTDLEPADQVGGAQVGAATPDGLYLYTAAERLAAGEWLYNALYAKAYAKAGWLGRLLTDAPSDVANQMLNSFAKDWSDTAAKDSDDWKNTSDANAVSPDNLMFWDEPSHSGPYGYAEPLIYREPRYDTITVHRWHLVQQKGSVHGQVRLNGAPTRDVQIQLYDGMTTASQADGSFRLDGVPYGNYQLNAQQVQQDGSFWSATVPVTIAAADTQVDVDLQPPPQQFRRVSINGKFHTRYTSWATFVKTDDESGDQSFSDFKDVGPYHTHEEADEDHTIQSAHANLHFWVDWQLDLSVTVHFKLSLHDKSAENTFNLTPGSWQSWTADASADNDSTHVEFTVSNDLRQA